MISRRSFVKKFAEKCKADSAALFLGAGMSIDAGLPSWKGLFAPLATELEIDIDNTNYQIYDIAQFYANEFGKNELYKKIGQEINRILKSSESLDQLSHMQCNSIWTTNFDQVLENNLERIGKITNVISKESDLIGCDLNKNINIFKLNGDIRDIQNAIVTKGDLEKYNENHNYYLAFFKKELITKTFLFLGYSFTDSLVLPCISELGRAFNNNQPHHYTILKRENSTDFIKFVKDLEERYQVDVLLIDSYDELPNILSEINYYTNQKNVFISGSYTENNEDKLLYIDELCRTITNILYKNGYTIINGYGYKVGYYIASEATRLLIEENVTDFKSHLQMYPFNEHSSLAAKTKHREFMIQKSNFSIFMFGSGYKNSGVIEEFRIAKKNKNRIIIPIGSTGGSANVILNEVKKNLIDYPYLEKYIDVLENETNSEIIAKTVYSIINENLKHSI
mgnify:CR=1 FL=1